MLQHGFGGKPIGALGKHAKRHPCFLDVVPYAACRIWAKHGHPFSGKRNSPQPHGPGALLVPEDGSDPPHIPGSWNGASASGIRGPQQWGPGHGRKMGGLSVTSIIIIKRTNRTMRTNRTRSKIFFHRPLICFSNPLLAVVVSQLCSYFAPAQTAYHSHVNNSLIRRV